MIPYSLSMRYESLKVVLFLFLQIKRSWGDWRRTRSWFSHPLAGSRGVGWCAMMTGSSSNWLTNQMESLSPMTTTGIWPWKNQNGRSLLTNDFSCTRLSMISESSCHYIILMCFGSFYTCLITKTLIYQRFDQNQPPDSYYSFDVSVWVRSRVRVLMLGNILITWKMLWLQLNNQNHCPYKLIIEYRVSREVGL